MPKFVTDFPLTQFRYYLQTQRLNLTTQIAYLSHVRRILRTALLDPDKLATFAASLLPERANLYGTAWRQYARFTLELTGNTIPPWPRTATSCPPSPDALPFPKEVADAIATLLRESLASEIVVSAFPALRREHVQWFATPLHNGTVGTVIINHRKPSPRELLVAEMQQRDLLKPTRLSLNGVTGDALRLICAWGSGFALTTPIPELRMFQKAGPLLAAPWKPEKPLAAMRITAVLRAHGVYVSDAAAARRAANQGIHRSQYAPFVNETERQILESPSTPAHTRSKLWGKVIWRVRRASMLDLMAAHDPTTTPRISRQETPVVPVEKLPPLPPRKVFHPVTGVEATSAAECVAFQRLEEKLNPPEPDIFDDWMRATRPK